VFSFTAMDRYELAWAAGFFDGEGWTNAVGQSGRRTRQPMARINQADANDVPQVLTRFQRALGGLGRIGGPDVKNGRQDLYRWEVSSRGDVEVLQHLLLPWLSQVKLLEFAQSLDREAARSRPAARTDEWRAWAAGLWDGEGSAYLLDHRSHAGRRIGELALTQSQDGAAPEVLHRFVAVVGGGQIYGPYRQQGATRDVYRWKVAAQTDIDPVIAALWPWLSDVKRRQAANVLGTLGAQALLSRGNPAWGNRKTHCVHGHEYATARIRPYVPRGVGDPPRDNHQCLQCAREQARTRRATKKGPPIDDDRRSISEHVTRYLLK
jgi:hypothetical protein